MWTVASWNKNKKARNLILEAGRGTGEGGSCGEMDQRGPGHCLDRF